MSDLLVLWQSTQSGRWEQHPSLFNALARRFIDLGEPLLGCDVAQEGLAIAPADVPLRHSLSLALVRSGASEGANALMTRLHAEGHADSETLGLLARTHKDLAEQAVSDRERDDHLRRSLEIYTAGENSAGEDTTRRIWNGINAATVALLLGHGDAAASRARQVRALATQQLAERKATQSDCYYPLATLGEAALILQEWDEAERCYLDAIAAVRGRYGFLKSTRRNARLLQAHFGRDAQTIERHFNIPRVVVFSGHTMDQPGRLVPRFPPALEPFVRDAIRSQLTRLNVGAGFASASCGADLLFLEEVQSLKAEAHVLLPYQRAEFVRARVDGLPGWRDRFERVLGSARVVTAGKQPMEGRAGAEYVSLLLLGLARIRAEKLGADLAPLVAWDGREGDGVNATADAVRLWRRLDYDVDRIDLAELLQLREPGTVVSGEPGTSVPGDAEEAWPEAPEGFETHRMAILFADAVKFSTLTDRQIPLFVRHFLGLIGDVLRESARQPIIKNTWGDGLYFVFDDVSAAGEFALDLSERIRGTQWLEKGLPESLGLRIALHAGPVYACVDPVTGGRNFLGTQVSRAARIEPITPPGHVYASEQFAALALAEKARAFVCEYVGQVPLPKNAGTLATYHVRRGTA